MSDEAERIKKEIEEEYGESIVVVDSDDGYGLVFDSREDFYRFHRWMNRRYMLMSSILNRIAPKNIQFMISHKR